MKELKRDLDHHLWKLIRHYELEDKKILVSFSGGVDSVALLLSLLKTHDRKQIGAFHFHHGEGSNLEYRNEAREFCVKFCAELQVPLQVAQATKRLSSESEYREARYAEILRAKNEKNYDLIALGHHRDDLFETRLLRLIRGTGGQGLGAMREWDQGLFRPFLTRGKVELENYVAEEKSVYLADPSNFNLDPLRNWLRQEWLPQLERRSSGACGVFARSLETLVEELEPSGDLLQHNQEFRSRGLQRSFYLTLSLSEQKRMLAQYLFALGKRNFSQSHLEEIQKRLDNSQKVITFQVGGSVWEINAEQIKVQS